MDDFARRCVNCGEALKRRCTRNGDWERTDCFNARRYCSTTCAYDSRRDQNHWNDERIEALNDLLAQDMTYRQCAAALSGRFGLGKLTRNHIAGVVNRQRENLDALSGEPLPRRKRRVRLDVDPSRIKRAPEKGSHQCAFGDCPRPRQPGRDLCAEHIREFVAERTPRRNAGIEIRESVAL